VGKTILITGATSGIGLASAAILSNMGANVIGVGKDPERNEKAKREILLKIPNAKIEYLLANLASQAQVRKLSQEVRDLFNKHGEESLDVLVNNAGIYLEKKQYSEDGIEKTFAVNHLAPFLLTHELLDLIKNSEQPRVLTMTSYSHRATPIILRNLPDPRPYIGLLAYKRSKLCNVLFTYELNRRVDGKILAFAVDPGLVNTSIASKGSDGISDLVWRFRRNQGTSPEVPARTIAYLSGSEGVETSGGYYFKDCTPIAPSKLAKNELLAKELWELSCELTGVDWL
jgi:NAD(P)-dependent dehydrogenase (short-subunit alcohol dehydrogenase family)